VSGKFDDGNFIFSLQVTCLVFCPITNMYTGGISMPLPPLCHQGGWLPASGAHTETIAQHPSLFLPAALARGIGRAPNENTPTNTPRDRSERTGSTSRSPANGATSAVAPMSPFRRPIDVRRRPLLRRRNMQKGVKRGAAGSLTGSVSEPRGFVAPVLKCGSIHHNGAGELPI
jgi:hypothetical protein